MRKLAGISVLVLLVGGIALARWLANDEALPEQRPSAGEVRGAPLRSLPAQPASEAAGAAASGAPPPRSVETSTATKSSASSAGEYAGLLPPQEAAKYPWIDFELLSDFEYPDPGERSPDEPPPELPEEVRELHGKLVALEGFMNPLAFDARGVSEFTLVSDPTLCCFGMTPRIHHFVHVTLPEGERCDFHSMVPIAVFGRLSIGEVEEDGFVLSLYRCEAHHVLSTY